MRIRHIVALSVAFALALAPAASAASSTGSSGALSTLPGLSPQSSQTGQANTTPATTTPTQTRPFTVPNPTTTSSSGGISTTDEIGLGVVVLLVLGGLARFIVRDARSRVPARPTREIDGVKGTVRPIEHRVKTARSKAKRARRARRASR